MKEKKNRRISSVLYAVFIFFVRIFYPKFTLVGDEILSGEPMIIVGNHSQMHGPIASELYFPKNTYIWCAGQMMSWKEVPAYAYSDFWSQKSWLSRPYYKLLSYLITPFCVMIFNNARTIPVRRDLRIVSTFRNSMAHLANGDHVIIFPEHDQKYNNIVYDFQDHFIDLARMYYKKSGREVFFVPLYIAPNLRKMYLGKPIKFDSTLPIEEERGRIREYLMNEITDMARSLPRHKVYPYRNIPKRLYPYNNSEEDK